MGGFFIINENLILGQLIQYFTDLQKNANDDFGVWKFPDGDKFYAYMIAAHTTTALSPDQVHALGLKEVARIQTEVLAELQTLNIATDNGYHELGHLQHPRSSLRHRT